MQLLKTAGQLAFVDLPMFLRLDAEDTGTGFGDHDVGAAPSDPTSARRGGEVRFDGVSKTFATPNGALRALDSVSFDVAPGEIFGVIGR